MRVLVVEDEELLAEAIATGLRREAVAVDVVHDGHSALENASVNDYDVIVLDRDLPGIHGDDVCRTLVANGTTARILMLTASGTLGDRVSGLDLGADDYLPKPFAFAELAARIRALGRRTAPASAPVLTRSGIILDTARHQAQRDGIPLQLTRKEFGVLHELMRVDGSVVTTERLLEKVWDENIDPFSGIVRFTIRQLRLKLGTPSPIETVIGMGYRLP